MWYGLVQPASGDLVSVGTEAMFPLGEDGQPNLNAYQGVYDVHTFGESRPDFALFLWNPTTRALVDRPIPLLISRLDDIEAWLAADPDWVAGWQALTPEMRQRIRQGLRKILNRLLGPQQWRGQHEEVEL